MCTSVFDCNSDRFDCLHHDSRQKSTISDRNMSQRKRRFEHDDDVEEEEDDDDSLPPGGDSETDDPEGANNEWEIQMIRSHYVRALFFGNFNFSAI